MVGYDESVTSIGIIGASGYTGAELLRLCGGHPGFEVAFATGDSQAGVAVAELYPSLAGRWPELRFVPFEPDLLDGVDGVFFALPHGASQELVPEVRGRVDWVIDLAADFRLPDASLYPRWYGDSHRAPELLPEFVYGLPELFRDRLIGADAIAVPGCYPTCTALSLAPLLANGLVETEGIIVDAVSGVSGAGRPPKPNTTFCAVDEDFTAYGLLDHRHTPEIEMIVGRMSGRAARVLFTPHLAPMNRGMLTTSYLRPTRSVTTDELLALYREFYADECFVQVTDASPSTKACMGSNSAHVTVRSDDRTGMIIALGAIDNLTKGASGQALQCANLLSGLPEDTGLSTMGVYP